MAATAGQARPMLEEFRDEARLLQAAEPGRRFAERHKRHKQAGLGVRVVSFLLGFAVLAAGIVMLAVPGPGWVAIFLGAGLLSGESLRVSRALDRVELRARAWGRRLQRWWRGLEHPRIVGTLLALATMVVVAGFCYATWRWLGIGIPFVDVLPATPR